MRQKLYYRIKKRRILIKLQSSLTDSRDKRDNNRYKLANINWNIKRIDENENLIYFRVFYIKNMNKIYQNNRKNNNE